MEALNIFFNEVSKITNEYSQKGECEMPSLYNKVKENKNFIELVDKMKAGILIEANDFEEFAIQIEIPDSLNKSFEETDPEDPFSAIMLSDVPLEIEKECVALLRNKLFSLLPTDRDIYAKIFARELDSKLFCEFDVISYIYEKGYEVRFLENSITAYIDSVIEVFAEFHINLVEYLKEDSEFDPTFGNYNNFCANKYLNESKTKANVSAEDSLVGINHSCAEPENIPSTNELSTKDEYSEELIKLFHGNTHLLSDLIGKSDDEIVALINKWARMKDGKSKPLIENPQNNLKRKFAHELKHAGFIKCTENTFRAKL